MKVNYKAPINLAALVWNEDGIFVAKMVDVELASQGKTKAEALSNLREAFELLIEESPKSINSSIVHKDLSLENLQFYNA